MLKACGGEAAGAAPRPAGRIVQFRAREKRAVITSRDQHLAVGQQRRRVQLACGGEGAGAAPHPGGRVVQFRASEIAAVVCPPATSTLPLGSNVAVCQKRAVLRLPVALQVPLAGSYSSALVR